MTKITYHVSYTDGVRMFKETLSEAATDFEARLFARLLIDKKNGSGTNTFSLVDIVRTEDTFRQDSIL